LLFEKVILGITVSPEMIRLSPRGGLGLSRDPTSGRTGERHRGDIAGDIGASIEEESGLLSSGSRLGIFALRAPPEALTKLKLRVEFARYFLFSPSCSTCAQALGAKRLNNVESNLRNGPCARQSIQW
jgi:hypothetical protein